MLITTGISLAIVGLFVIWLFISLFPFSLLILTAAAATWLIIQLIVKAAKALPLDH